MNLSESKSTLLATYYLLLSNLHAHEGNKKRAVFYARKVERLIYA